MTTDIRILSQGEATTKSANRFVGGGHSPQHNRQTFQPIGCTRFRWHDPGGKPCQPRPRRRQRRKWPWRGRGSSWSKSDEHRARRHSRCCGDRQASRKGQKIIQGVLDFNGVDDQREPSAGRRSTRSTQSCCGCRPIALVRCCWTSRRCCLPCSPRWIRCCLCAHCQICGKLFADHSRPASQMTRETNAYQAQFAAISDPFWGVTRNYWRAPSMMILMNSSIPIL